MATLLKRTEAKPAGTEMEVAQPDVVLPALRLVETPVGARRLGKLLLLLLVLSVIAMLFAPWQQTVSGTGKVVAYAPLQRQQIVESPISGRIVRWNEKLFEGAKLSEGEFIVEIRDIDPSLVSRLEDQLSASQQKVEAAELMVEAYRGKVTAFEEAQTSVIEAVEKQVEMAKEKVEAEIQGLEAAKAAEQQTEANWKRQQLLNEDGLASELAYEVAERSQKEAESKVEQAQAYLRSAERELESKKAEAKQKEREAKAKIDTAKAEYQKALSEVALAKKEQTDDEVKLSRQQSQTVVAPRDGTVFRLLANQGGDIVKAGDPLLTIVPETAQRAVEIWLSGNDAPLVTEGRHVRLQFEGWPAVQFAGWPSVAVGTFGGTVASVDATDNGLGQFRILVLPDKGADWPSDRYLRQGVRANGWVLLSQVKLGYEAWRQLNDEPGAARSPQSELWRLPPASEIREGANLPGPPKLLPQQQGHAARPVPSAIYDQNVQPASLQAPVVDGYIDIEDLPTPNQEENALQLDDVVDSIYATFPLLQIAYRQREVAAGQQLAAWGKFDTDLNVGAIEEPMGFYQNYRQGIEAKQKTWGGAEVFGGYRIGRGLFEPWYGERETDKSGEFKLGITAPLLRGRAIDKQRADVLKSQVALRAVEPAIQTQIIDFVRNGSHAYWEWVAAGQSYRVAQTLLDIAVDRDEGIRKRVERGDLAEIEVVDNQRLIVSRRAKLIQADRKLQQSAIKLSLWLRSADGVPRVPVPGLLPQSFHPPELPDVVVLDNAISIALQMRPELLEISLAAQEVEIELANSRNQMLPGLSVGLVASKDIGPRASPKGDKRPFELEAAVLADVPLQRRYASGSIQVAQGKLAQLNAERRFASDKITVEVRDSIAALTTAMDQVRQAKEAVELNLRMEAAEQRKFDLGTSDLLVVNLREQATADAAQTEVDALLEFYKAQVNFDAAIGRSILPAE
ncbi:Leukotoxin export protein LtxD [Durusdinium trenchii]|uniref:Leukotoxin export protein LtxD n=1 Tax=Durusdinium trenchii TaxID=1381693 RepID=A0ABP0PWN0_9DINO